MTGLNIPVNIASLVPWKQLLPALGLEASAGALPCTLRCPVCNEASLTLHPLPAYPQNTTPGGQWHYCSNCKTAGDNLELAVRVWGGDVGDVAARLVRLGLLTEEAGRPAAVEAYRHYGPLRRQEIQQFWKQAREHFPCTGPDLFPLKQLIGYQMMKDRLCWTAHQDVLVGGLQREAIREFLGPQRIAIKGQRLRAKQRAESWQEAALLAFEDAPGRIAAFLFAVGRAEPDQVCYRTADRVREKQIPPVPAGVAFLQAAMTDVDLAIPLVVSLDPFTALHLHIWGLGRKNELFPLVACWAASPPAEILRYLAGNRKLIIWNRKATADLYRHAKALDAWVTIPQTTQEAEPTHTFGLTLPEHLRQIGRRSEYWMDSLRTTILECSPAVGDTLLEQIGMSPEEKKRFLTSCPPEHRDRFGHVAGLHRLSRETVIGQKTIIEDEHGWRHINGSLISDVIMRIDTVFHQKASNSVWYQGRLLFQGQEVPFTFDQSHIDYRRLPAMLRRHLIQAGAGIPRVAANWGEKLLDLSLAFHSPQHIHEFNNYGWNESSQRFILPDYAIELGGKVVELQTPKLRLSRIPAANLLKPVYLQPDELQELVTTPAREVIWNTLLVILHNVLAPAYHYKAVGLAVATKEVMSAVADVARAAGCCFASTQFRINQEYLHAESWPVIVLPHQCTVSLSGLRWSEWLQGPQNALVKMDPLKSRVVFINGNWFFLDKEETPQLDQPTLNSITRLVPDFLQFVMGRRLSGGLWGVEPVQRVRDELTAYLTTRGLEADLSGLTAKLRWHETDRTDCFGQLLAYLLDEGLARIVGPSEFKSAYRRYPGQLIMHYKGDIFWVPKIRLNNLLLTRNLPALELRSLARRLDRGGVLRQDVDEEAEPGWGLARDWWKTILQNWQAVSRGLRLVT